MEKHTDFRLLRYANSDGAMLLLRWFAGAAILFYDIGKMQTYNEIIDSYPTLLSIPPTVVFALSVGLEALLATLLLIGRGVRPASVLLAIGALARAFVAGRELLTADFAWAGIFLLLAIAGGGPYAWMKSASAPSDRKK